MKCRGVLGLVFVVSILEACGSGSSPRNINGFYLGQISDASTPVLYISTNLAQASGSAVDITGFGIGSLGSFPACFSTTTTQTATFTASGHSNGFVTGAFQMTVATAFPGTDNVLTLSGNRTGDGTISGTWVMTGQSGCSDSGAFTLSPPPPV